MYLYRDNLYVSGDEIYQYKFKNWPQVDELILEHPYIKVREIFEEGNILAYAGRNSFKMMYLNKKVNFYQDEQMDKIIFKDGLFIDTNENVLKIGSYKIIPPYTVCTTSSPKYLGIHNLVFKTYAECNETYFKENNIDKYCRWKKKYVRCPFFVFWHSWCKYNYSNC